MARRRTHLRRRSEIDPQLTLDDALAGMSSEFIECRDFGHAWFSWRVLPQGSAIVEQWLKCSRCEGVRKRIISRTGEQTGRGYTMPEGYALKGFGNLSGTDRDVLRTISLGHILAQAESSAKGTRRKNLKAV